jgi:hypothetical protein
MDVHGSGSTSKLYKVKKGTAIKCGSGSNIELTTVQNQKLDLDDESNRLGHTRVSIKNAETVNNPPVKLTGESLNAEASTDEIQIPVSDENQDLTSHNPAEMSSQELQLWELFRACTNELRILRISRVELLSFLRHSLKSVVLQDNLLTIVSASYQNQDVTEQLQMIQYLGKHGRALDGTGAGDSWLHIAPGTDLDALIMNATQLVKNDSNDDSNDEHKLETNGRELVVMYTHLVDSEDPKTVAVMDGNQLSIAPAPGNKDLAASLAHVLAANLFQAVEMQLYAAFAKTSFPEKQDLPYTCHKYSSTCNRDKTGSGHGRGRLTSDQAWSASECTDSQWLELHAGTKRWVAGVVIGGRKNTCTNQKVTAFRVKYQSSLDSNLKSPTAAYVDNFRVFQVNYTGETEVSIRFSQPVEACTIRIEPVSWEHWVSMRVALLNQSE